MKRILLPFYLIYYVLVFLPVGVVLTMLTALITICIMPLSKGAKWSYYPAILWARLLCIIAFVRVKVEGRELYDTHKSYVFVANHQSIYDVFPIYGYIGNRFVWIMKKEIKKIPLVGQACDAVGHIFIDRSSAIKAKHSLEDAERKLRNGLSVVIFPEGSRTRTGAMNRFKRGAFSIATDLKLPIVPISISGAYQVWPVGCWHVSPGTITLKFHQPIETTDVNSDNLNDLVEQVHDIIEAGIVKN